MAPTTWKFLSFCLLLRYVYSSCDEESFNNTTPEILQCVFCEFDIIGGQVQGQSDCLAKPWCYRMNCMSQGLTGDLGHCIHYWAEMAQEDGSVNHHYVARCYYESNNPNVCLDQLESSRERMERSNDGTLTSYNLCMCNHEDLCNKPTVEGVMAQGDYDHLAIKSCYQCTNEYSAGSTIRNECESATPQPCQFDETCYAKEMEFTNEIGVKTAVREYGCQWGQQILNDGQAQDSSYAIDSLSDEDREELETEHGSGNLTAYSLTYTNDAATITLSTDTGYATTDAISCYNCTQVVGLGMTLFAECVGEGQAPTADCGPDHVCGSVEIVTQDSQGSPTFTRVYTCLHNSNYRLAGRTADSCESSNYIGDEHTDTVESASEEDFVNQSSCFCSSDLCNVPSFDVPVAPPGECFECSFTFIAGSLDSASCQDEDTVPVVTCQQGGTCYAATRDVIGADGVHRHVRDFGCLTPDQVTSLPQSFDSSRGTCYSESVVDLSSSDNDGDREVDSTQCFCSTKDMCASVPGSTLFRNATSELYKQNNAYGDPSRSDGSADGSSGTGDSSSVDGDGSSVDGDGSSVDGDGSSVDGDGSSVDGDGSSVDGDGSSGTGDSSSVEDDGYDYGEEIVWLVGDQRVAFFDWLVPGNNGSFIDFLRSGELPVATLVAGINADIKVNHNASLSPEWSEAADGGDSADGGDGADGTADGDGGKDAGDGDGDGGANDGDGAMDDQDDLFRGDVYVTVEDSKAEDDDDAEGKSKKKEGAENLESDSEISGSSSKKGKAKSAASESWRRLPVGLYIVTLLCLGLQKRIA